MKTTPSQHAARHAAGFTLLELVLAMTVTAVVSAALFTSLSGSFKTRKSAEDHLAGRAMARNVIATLRKDWQCIPPAGGRVSGVFIGEDLSGMNSSDADTLTYVTANPDLTSEQDFADLRQIELRLLTSNDDPDHYVLARLVTGNLLATTTQSPAVQIIARRVVSMNLQYYDGGEWLDEWDSTDRDNEIPLAIEIVLVTAPELSREPIDDREREAGYLTSTQVVRLPAAEASTDGINLGF